MDIIEKTRELGKMIQQDERYKAYVAAREGNDNDPDLQQLISEFNVKRSELNNEMIKDDKDTEKLKSLDEEIKTLYGKIMDSEPMIKFNEAKSEMDSLLSQINNIITMCANGEDPDTCSTTPSCSGSCASCAGCH
ncbi:MAG: YlbF family regulator [Ruminococcus sp.]|nr:YlbF family regulator [Ruminococcus sp.]